ncbi:CD59 glycoprotein [Boleophthalmus pectinirostris]|uniref:CD59 glycoprotein n=1 Tax=Boleophthalmus pectinirostris TaxID=150288 RepID=UPI000A1C67E3|nr:CD59 glycoprotein [Boleophthalmus pectinirostris]
MKCSVGLVLVLLSSLLSLGESVQCFSCQDYSGTCSKTRECSQDDACLTLKARGGNTYRRCIKYTECTFDQLSLVYSEIPSFKFSCCTSDLCNSAPAGSASVLIGLLCSLLTMWWTAH